MTAITDSFCLILLSQLPHLGSATINFILKLTSTEHISLPQLLNLNLKKRKKLFPQLSSPILNSLDRWESALPETKALLTKLKHSHISFTTILDKNYPQRLKAELGDKAPPVIFYKVNWALLQQPGIAVVGTRQPTPPGQQATYNLVYQLARQNVNILSGMAPGIDTTAHLAALKAHGTTTFILNHGILNFRPPAQIKKLITPGLSTEAGFAKADSSAVDNLSKAGLSTKAHCAEADNSLALSPFPPGDKFRTAYAIQRNYLLAALAHSLIVGETQLRGGSAYAINHVIKTKKPLFAFVYPPTSKAHKGTNTLISSGAIPIPAFAKPASADKKPYQRVPRATIRHIIRLTTKQASQKS